MAAAKRPALPFLLTASDLLDGDVVYWTGRKWDRALDAALVARDAEEADQLEAVLAAAEARGVPVAPYLVKVTLGSGRPVPDHVRERLRGLGPSIRPDLGPQARPARETLHVSL
jgi:hypothetical protein